RPSSPTRSKAERPPLILSCSGAMCVIGSRQSGPNTIVSASPTLWKQEKRKNFLVHLLADRGQSSRLPTRNRLADHCCVTHPEFGLCDNTALVRLRRHANGAKADGSANSMGPLVKAAKIGRGQAHHGMTDKTTPLYVVCSPCRRVGKTLVSRLLTEFY